MIHRARVKLSGNVTSYKVLAGWPRDVARAVDINRGSGGQYETDCLNIMQYVDICHTSQSQSPCFSFSELGPCSSFFRHFIIHQGQTRIVFGHY